MKPDRGFLDATIAAVAGIASGHEVSASTLLDGRDLRFSGEKMETLLDSLDPKNELFPKENRMDVLEYGLSSDASDVLTGADHTVLRLASVFQFAFCRAHGDCDNGCD